MLTFIVGHFIFLLVCWLLMWFPYCVIDPVSALLQVWTGGPPHRAKPSTYCVHGTGYVHYISYCY
jgi:hypothetical protein